jgi:hypothetical protein
MSTSHDAVGLLVVVVVGVADHHFGDRRQPLLGLTVQNPPQLIEDGVVSPTLIEGEPTNGRMVVVPTHPREIGKPI